jgi:hypothetical protein
VSSLFQAQDVTDHLIQIDLNNIFLPGGGLLQKRPSDDWNTHGGEIVYIRLIRCTSSCSFALLIVRKE